MRCVAKRWRTRGMVVALLAGAFLAASPLRAEEAGGEKAGGEKADAKPEPKEQKPEPQELHLRRHGSMSVSGNEYNLEVLPQIFRNLVKQGKLKTDQPLVIRVEKRCNFRLVQEAMKVCQAAGFKNVRLAVEEDDSPPKPNVLLILVDDLGYGDLGCYGSEDLKTPNIDRLAEEGMRMTSFYASCCVCSPTRAALLTGRWPDAVGVPGVIRTHAANSHGLLRDDVTLLPAVLDEAGYRTVMVGKWHLGLGPPNLPNLRGFDVFYGFLGDMMDDYWSHRRHGINYMRLDGREIDPEGHATDLFSNWAAHWIEHYRGDEPFFIYLPYNAPHDPIQPPEEYLTAYKARYPQADERRAKLAAFIEHLDAGIGRVLEALKESGWEQHTLVVFTSDNGGLERVGADNGPWRDGKGSYYEGGIRVPTLFRWPGRVQAGASSAAVAVSMDLYPTLLELAGVEPQEKIDGVSLVPVLMGRETELPQRDLFFVRRESFGRIEGMRRGRWKLVQPKPGAAFELYDLEADPKESNNLAARQPEVLEQMEKAFDAHRAACADVPWRPESGVGPGEIGPERK